MTGPVGAFFYNRDVSVEIAALANQQLQIAEHAVKMGKAVSCEGFTPRDHDDLKKQEQAFHNARCLVVGPTTG